MASITRELSGRRVIQFVGADKKRRSVRLGKVSQKVAEAVKVRIEQLVSATITGHAMDDETARWIAGLDHTLRDRLAAVRLVPRREVATLAAFLDGYIASRADVKGSTATVYGHTRRCLVQFFGADKPLRDITEGDADAWRLWLIGNQELADNTVRRRSGIARQFFKAAVRRKLISVNPFADLVAAVRGNDERQFFVTRDATTKVVEACPDAEWRLIVALSRFGGLRCPSEHLGLRWEHVDWANGRVTVRSPKTEHHEGGASRVIPIFPELLPFLRGVFERAEPGVPHVITRYRDATQNLGTQFRRIVRRAGLDPWPKLFHNMRASRETELAEDWPSHVVCKWIGNSRRIAMEHYLQVTDEHFAKAVQNPVQQAYATSRAESQDFRDESVSLGECDDLRDDAAECETDKGCQLGVTGLEPVTSCMSSRRSSQLS